MELRDVAFDRVEAERLELPVVQVLQLQDFEHTQILVRDDHGPVERHLDAVRTHAQVGGGAREHVEEDEGDEVEIHVLRVAIVQHAVAQIVHLIGDRRHIEHRVVRREDSQFLKTLLETTLPYHALGASPKMVFLRCVLRAREFELGGEVRRGSPASRHAGEARRRKRMRPAS